MCSCQLLFQHYEKQTRRVDIVQIDEITFLQC
jgi:hypothetical protein